MTVYPYQALEFDAADICTFFQGQGIKLTLQQTEQILAHTVGWPLAVSLLCTRMESKAVLNKALFTEVERDVYDYFDTQLLSHWTPEKQRFLCSMCLFTSFTQKLAARVSGQSNAYAMLDDIMQNSSF